MIDTLYLLACGIFWNKTGSERARREVARALRSSDPCLRCAAELVTGRSGRLPDLEGDSACVCNQAHDRLPHRQSFATRTSAT